MKRDDKKVMSFRFSDHILDKIDYLAEEDSEEMKKLGLKSKTRKQIIEECIQDCYLRKINNDKDPDTMNRISIMVNDAADVRFIRMKKIMDEILFLTIKNDLANRLLLMERSLPVAPSTESIAIDMVVNKGSRWDEVLQNYMTGNWTRMISDIHNGRRLPR